MNRRKFLLRASSTLAVALAGCGGAEPTLSASNTPAPSTPSPPVPPAPPPPAGPVTPTGGTTPSVIPSGPGLPALTLHSSQSGTFPYFATAYPAEGAVPAGSSIVSPDDPTLRASILSTWPDGSAQVAVVAGSASVASTTSRSVRLAAGLSSGAALTPADIQGRFNASGIEVNFGGGVQQLSSFGSPDWIWWANSQVICARYRLPCGLGALQAVIDVHAFAGGRALVEIVIENGKLNADANPVVAPATVTYSGATVSVNGVAITPAGGVSSPTQDMAAPRYRARGSVCRYQSKPGTTNQPFTGGHEHGRAWYCSTWIGGDPGIFVTHDTTYLQSLPYFFKAAVPSSENMQTKYSQTYDEYEPWATGRLRVPAMDGGGDDEEIAPYSMVQSDYIVTGDPYAARAVLATTKALLSMHLSYRDAGTGAVPTPAQAYNKCAWGWANWNWPTQPATEPAYGGADSYNRGGNASHIPAIGVVAFLCHPSPYIIELCQKESLRHATQYGAVNGVHDYEQPRSRAWLLRSYAQAIFLSPDRIYSATGTPVSEAVRKDGYRGWMYNSVALYRQALTPAWNKAKVFVSATVSNGGGEVSDAAVNNPPMAGIQIGQFMHNFLGATSASVAAMKPLRVAAQAATLDAFADDMALFHVKWITDASGTEWRVIPYNVTVGVQDSPKTVDMGDGNLATKLKADLSGTPYTSPGPWKQSFGNENFDTLSDVNSAAGGPNVSTYSAMYFAALVAAVERDIPGASTAWARVYGTNGSDGGVSNLMAWRASMGHLPHWNRWPRNK